MPNTSAMMTVSKPHAFHFCSELQNGLIRRQTARQLVLFLAWTFIQHFLRCANNCRRAFKRDSACPG